jgi:hypothetical protein
MATGRHPVVGFVRWPIVASALWTLFVWVTRVRNAMSDDEMSGGEKTFAGAVSFVFIGAAVTLLLLVLRRRTDQLRTLLPVFAIGTVGWWLVRSVMMLLDDHGWGFRIVHLALAIISSVLAVLAWRVTVPERALAGAGGVRS